MLKLDLGWIEKLEQEKGSRLMPVVLAVEQVHGVLGCAHPRARNDNVSKESSG